MDYCRRCDDSGLVPNPDPESNVKVPCPDCCRVVQHAVQFWS